MSSTCSSHVWEVPQPRFLFGEESMLNTFFVVHFCVVNKIAGNRVIRYPQCATVYLKTGSSLKMSLTHVPAPIFLETQ